MSARAIIVGGLALLACVQVVRTAVVSAYAGQAAGVRRADLVQHTRKSISLLAMAEIGQAAGGGKTDRARVGAAPRRSGPRTPLRSPSSHF